jgi:Ca2+-binding EF-hand superfamily protein
MYKRVIVLLSALATADVAMAQNNRSQTRFQGMDRNNDGRITRAEWRGSSQAFDNQDWNGDGVLSGDEVRPGARRNADNFPNQRFDDWTARGFASLDENRDGRLNANEWLFNEADFRRADHNGDGVVTRSEFLSEAAGRDDENPDARIDRRTERFRTLDRNRNNEIDRDEWNGTSARYEVLDTNRDGVLSPREMVTRDVPNDGFAAYDVNRDRVLTRNEWHWTLGSFDRLDVNNDNRITRAELERPAQQQNNAFRAGYNRGVTDGREAGRGDRQTNWGWDLDGQQELERADAGYSANLGSRADYQAGYREGFRRAYAEGYRGQ